MSCSRASIFGVVPQAISAWKPLIAPQAMVMKTNGNTGPGTTNPPPWMNGVSAGICSGGASTTMNTPSSATVPSFMKVLR